jgi:hypothetical protein
VKTYASFMPRYFFVNSLCEFDQNPMGLTIGVSKQGYNDMTVAEVQER